MSIRSTFGIDGFDLFVHAAATVDLVALGESNRSPATITNSQLYSLATSPMRLMTPSLSFWSTERFCTSETLPNGLPSCQSAVWRNVTFIVSDG